MNVGTITRNHIIGLILFLEVAAIGAFIWFYAMPVNSEIATVEVEIKNKQRNVREIEDTKHNLAQTNAEIEKLNKDINRLEKYFSEEVYIPRTLQLLENLSQATGMDIESIKPEAEKTSAMRPPAAGAKAPAPKSSGNAAAGKKAGQEGAAPEKPKKVFNADQEYRTTTVNVALTGKFKNLNNFLSELAYFPKLVVVSKLDITLQTQATQGAAPGLPGQKVAVETQTGGFNLNVKMPMVFYIQKQTQEKAVDKVENKSVADGIKQGIEDKRSKEQAGKGLDEE